MNLKLYDANEEWNAFSLKTRHVQSPLLFLILPVRKSESFPRPGIPFLSSFMNWMNFETKYEIES